MFHSSTLLIDALRSSEMSVRF